MGAKEVSMINNGLGPAAATYSPVRIKLSSVVRGDGNGPDANASVNLPSVADATAALHRTARVNATEKLLSVSTDYRRAAIAAGPLQSLWRIDVEAYGTVVAMPEEAAKPAEEPAAEDDPV
jgi:hypothetical protein